MYNEGKSNYIFVDGEIKQVNPAVEVMIGSADDLNSLTGLAPGSWAYIAGGSQRWQLGLDGSWVAEGTVPEETTEPEEPTEPTEE